MNHTMRFNHKLWLLKSTLTLICTVEFQLVECSCDVGNGNYPIRRQWWLHMDGCECRIEQERCQQSIEVISQLGVVTLFFEIVLPWIDVNWLIWRNIMIYVHGVACLWDTISPWLQKERWRMKNEEWRMKEWNKRRIKNEERRDEGEMNEGWKNQSPRK